jgi:hypothetical protein
MAVGSGPVKELGGLLIQYDPGDARCYPGTGTTLYDLSGNSNHGTLTNGPTVSTALGGFLTLDGSNDYVITPFTTILSDCTIALWFRNTSAKKYQYIFSFDNGSTDTYGFHLDLNDSDGGSASSTLWAYWNGGGDPHKSTIAGTGNSGNWSDNSWRHYIFTRSGSTINHYMNGSLVTVGVTNGGTQNTQFGNGAGYNIHLVALGRLKSLTYGGDIAQLLVYSKALSETEIKNLYDSTKNRFSYIPPISINSITMNLDAGTSVSYPGSGTVWYDLSGSNNVAVLTSTAKYSKDNGGYINLSGGAYATMSNRVLNNLSAGTIQCWVYFTSVVSGTIVSRQRGGVDSYTILSVGNYADNTGNRQTGTPGKIYYHLRNAVSNIISNTTLRANTWYNIALTFNTSEVRLYVNGILDIITPGNFSTANDLAADCRIGDWAGVLPMSGYIATIRTYNRALTASEIFGNFDALRGRFNLLSSKQKNGLLIDYRASDPSSYSGTGTTWYDLSGNNFDATITNATFNYENRGIFNFNGSNTYINVARPSALANSSEISIVLWAKWTSVGTGITTIQCLVDNNHSSPGTGFLIQDRPDLNKRLSFDTFPGPTGILSTFQVGDGKWHHIVGTNGNGISRLYIDGRLNNWGVSAKINNVQTNIRIGNAEAYGRYLNGSIGQFAIYNKALSASEVSSLHNDTKQNYLSYNSFGSLGLVLDLDFSDPRCYNGGSSVFDLSGNGLVGTISGGPYFVKDSLRSYFTNFTGGKISFPNTTFPYGATSRTIISVFRYVASAEPYQHIIHYGAAGFSQSFGLTVRLNLLNNHTWSASSRNTSFTLESGKDYFGAVSFNDSSSPKNTFYINGIRGTTGFEIQSSDYAINTVASDNFNIGLRISSSGSQEPWGPGGRIYLVKVYNRALTQSEIKSIYDSLRGRYNI